MTEARAQRLGAALLILTSCTVPVSQPLAQTYGSGLNLGCYINRPGEKERSAAWRDGWVTGFVEICFEATGWLKLTTVGLDRWSEARHWSTSGPNKVMLDQDACLVTTKKNGDLLLAACPEAGLWEIECSKMRLVSTCAPGF